MKIRGRLKQIMEKHVEKIYTLTEKYQKLKKKIGKTAVLDKLKMHIRKLPTEREQVLLATEVVFELGDEDGVPYIEVVRKVMCLTALPESRVEDLLPYAYEELGIGSIEMSDEEIAKTLQKKGDVIDEYCDILLKRRFRERITKD